MDYSAPQIEQKVGPIYFCCVCFSLFVYVVRPGEIIPVLGHARLGLVSFALVGVAFFASDGLGAVREMVPAGARLMKVLVLLGFCSIVFAVWPTGAYVGSRRLLINMALYFFWLPAVRSPAQLRMLVVVLALSAGALVCCQLLGDLAHDTMGRLSVGMSYDSNDLAMVLSVIFPIAVFLFLDGRLLGKGLWGAVVAAIVMGVLSTGSRGGLVALGVAGTLLIFTARKSIKTWHRLFVLVLAVGFFLSPVADIAKERFQDVLSGEDYNFQSGEDGKGGGRLMIWRDTLPLIARHPLTGVGAGCSTVAMGTQVGYWKATHSGYLQIALDLGLPGVVVFLLILGTIWRNCSRSLRMFTPEPDLRSLALLAVCTRIALVTYMVAAMFLSQAYTILIPILLLLSNGLACVFEQVEYPCEELEYCDHLGTIDSRHAKDES